MSKFKLLKNYNGHLIGEMLEVRDVFDEFIETEGIGKKVIVKAENKAVAPKYKRKK
ncbi:MAG: hypothetical protein GWP06_02240 [Actinobacteria bacterium]|nr:hypothetical protein [Actinomycetota bacterium]